MDVNAVVYCDGDKKAAQAIQEVAADNIKRVIRRIRIGAAFGRACVKTSKKPLLRDFCVLTQPRPYGRYKPPLEAILSIF
jgi:hypothetical protein